MNYYLRLSSHETASCSNKERYQVNLRIFIFLHQVFCLGPILSHFHLQDRETQFKRAILLMNQLPSARRTLKNTDFTLKSYTLLWSFVAYYFESFNSFQWNPAKCNSKARPTLPPSGRNLQFGRKLQLRYVPSFHDIQIVMLLQCSLLSFPPF